VRGARHNVLLTPRAHRCSCCTSPGARVPPAGQIVQVGSVNSRHEIDGESQDARDSTKFLPKMGPLCADLSFRDVLKKKTEECFLHVAEAS